MQRSRNSSRLALVLSALALFGGAASAQDRAWAVLVYVMADNNDEPRKLAEFIAWGIKTYPAQQYALVVWDHGGAWPGYGEDDAHDGAGFDLAALTGAIGAGLKGGGVKQFDLDGFDACLMATYEVARSVRPLTKYFLASEELEPGHGWDYSVLTALGKSPDTETLGKTIIKGFADSSTREGDREEISLSLLNLQKMDSLDKALGSFANFGRTKINQIAPQLGRIQNKTQGFGKSAKPENDTNMIDLGQFISLYAENDKSASAIKQQFDAALAALVVDKVSGNLTKGSTGLSIYFPNQKRYYSASSDAIDSGPWKALLADYYKSGSSLSPPKDAGNYILAFANADNTGEVSGTWDRQALKMKQGESETEATTGIGFDPTKGLSYDYEALDAKTTDIYLELEIYDVGDNSDYINYKGSAAKI
ncbi:MAG: clostripain-related cysteine peptidase [Spirochaetota bacterium]